MDTLTATGTSASSAASSGTQSASTDKTDAAVVSSDFETFLVMLTAQLENQDPLNPMDSSDYAVQLATFSSVEQQVRTNDLLREMIDGSTLSGLADLAGWVGMEARSTAPVSFAGEPVTLYFEPQTGAARTDLVVRDASGSEVQTLTITGQDSPILWTGVDGYGEPMPDGTYSFEQVSYSEDAISETLPVESFAQVTEVRQGADGAEIVLEGDFVLAADSVSAVRQPDGG